MKKHLFIIFFMWLSGKLAYTQGKMEKDFTEIDFQFLQTDNKPFSVNGLNFQFRLLDSTNNVVVIFKDDLEIIRVSNYKIKVKIFDNKIANLKEGNYNYELIEVKDIKERLWQKGVFKVRNNVGTNSSIVGYNPSGKAGGLIDLLRKEVDPTVGQHIKNITQQQIIMWDSISKQKQSIYIPPTPVNSVIYQSNYAQNDSGIVVLNGTANITRNNGQLNITDINGAIGFGDYKKYRDGQLLNVFINFVKVTGDVMVYPRFGNNYGFLLSKTGKYYFTISRSGTYPLENYNTLILQPASGSNSFTINELIISDGGAGFDVNTPYIKLGNGAKGDFNSVIIGKNANYAGNFRDGIVVGTNAQTDQQGSIVIGAEANGNHDSTYGCASGNDQTVVGYASRGYGWRTTAIGAWSIAGGQSSTALGAGAASLTSHSVAIGRGAFAANIPNLSGILTTDVRKLYFGNSYAHRFPKHPTNEVDYNIGAIEPNSTEIEIHGQDAFDASEIPSDFNKSAGHLGLYSGRGTGTGAGGEIRFYTAPTQPNIGKNDKNPILPAAKFDSSTNTTDGTRFLLYDTQSGNLKRVKLAPVDAQGRKILYVDN